MVDSGFVLLRVQGAALYEGTSGSGAPRRWWRIDPQGAGPAAIQAAARDIGVLAALGSVHPLGVAGLRELEDGCLRVELPPAPFEDQGLDAALSGGAPLPLAWVRTLARGLCAQVASLHQQGIVHGGLCPPLVRVGAGPESLSSGPHLLGAGWSSLWSHFARDPEAPPEVVRYRPPELLQRVRRRPDRQADLYAIGCLVVEALSGKPVFRASEAGRLREAILRGHPSTLLPLLGEEEEALDRVLSRCLSAEPSERHPSATALWRELAPALGAAADPLPTFHGGWARARISTKHRGRRGARLARREEGEYSDVFNRRGTQPAGVDRRPNAVGILARAHLSLPSAARPDPAPAPAPDLTVRPRTRGAAAGGFRRGAVALGGLLAALLVLVLIQAWRSRAPSIGDSDAPPPIRPSSMSLPRGIARRGAVDGGVPDSRAADPPPRVRVDPRTARLRGALERVGLSEREVVISSLLGLLFSRVAATLRSQDYRAFDKAMRPLELATRVRECGKIRRLKINYILGGIRAMGSRLSAWERFRLERMLSDANAIPGPCPRRSALLRPIVLEVRSRLAYKRARGL